MNWTMTRFASLAALLAVSCGDDSVGSGTETGTGNTIGSVSDTTVSTGSESGDPGQFEDEREYELRLNPAPSTPLELSLNKEQSLELFGESAKDILLLEVDTTDLLVNTLDEIKDACGTDWKLDNEDANHDCTLTPLGQSFGPNWQCSAEYSMVRLLTMTPANVIVEGTSIEGTQGIADFLNLGGGFSEILASSLGIGMTEEFITTPFLVQALKADMLATHPEIGGDGSIMSITMWDGLHDMETLGERFGPVGNHPGVLAPGFTPYSDALGPDFSMNAITESNLRQLDGLDAGTDKEFISIIVDTVGPSFNDPVEFDFEDPEKFSIDGLAQNPTVDMRFGIGEHPQFVPSCTIDDVCWTNLPGNPVGNQHVWSLDTWIAEYIVAHAGLFKYDERQYDDCIATCFLGLRIVIGENGDFPGQPNGWIRFIPANVVIDFLLNILGASPPEDQYLWDMISEIGQVVLHEPPGCPIAEGDANVEFTLHDIPIGITGPEMEDAVRPYLQEQAPEIADLLLGNYKENNGKVDFYYRAEADGEGYIFFVHPDDQAEGLPYAYDKTGFYDCSAVSDDCKASSTTIEGAGDTVHEKIKLQAGETVLYMQDDEGDVYRTTFIVPEAEGAAQSITVRVAKKVG